MGKQEDEKLLNSLLLISGYISNELNNGKNENEIVDDLVNNMKIDRNTAKRLVFKNTGFSDKMYFFSKNYIRKSVLIFVLLSLSLYSILFLLIVNLDNYNFYVQISKYLTIIFFILFLLSGIVLRDTKNIIYNYINIIFSFVISISSFISGGLLYLYMNWDNIQKIHNSLGNPIFRIFTASINGIIEIGPQVTGIIFLVISLIFTFICWKFYYDLTIIKLDSKY